MTRENNQTPVLRQNIQYHFDRVKLYSLSLYTSKNSGEINCNLGEKRTFLVIPRGAIAAANTTFASITCSMLA